MSHRHQGVLSFCLQFFDPAQHCEMSLCNMGKLTSKDNIKHVHCTAHYLVSTKPWTDTMSNYLVNTVECLADN